MFSFFKKAKHVRLDDKIYINRNVADVAFIEAYNKLKAENTAVFIFCFFEKSMERLKPLFPEQDTTLLHVEKIRNHSVNPEMRIKIKNSRNPVFLFAEHYPQYDIEQQIITEIESLCQDNKPSIGFFAALEEPFLQQFGTEKIIDLMRRMGMKEDEVISHGMVTKSIINVQKKLAQKVTQEITAKSQEEWIAINVPK